MLRLPPLPLSRLVTPTDVVYGAGSLAVLKLLDAGRIVVFTRRGQTADRVRALLPGRVEVLSPSWTGEPTLEALQGSIRDVELAGPDWIVAIGGGSVIDGARLVWLTYECPHLDLLQTEKAINVPRLRSRARFCAVPTTAGSGAEASPAVAFEQRSYHGKRIISSPELIPDLVLLDPRLTIQLPASVTVSSALDAFTHAVEGFTSAMQNPLVDGLAVDSARGVAASLAIAVDEPENEAARGELLMAAFRAGTVQAHRIPGLSHAVAHQLGSLGVAHGTANAILLPHVIRMNARHLPTNHRYSELASRAGIGATADDLAEFTERMTHKIGLPTTVRQVVGDASEGTIKLVIAGALKDSCARGNPVPVDELSITALLEAAWG